MSRPRTKMRFGRYELPPVPKFPTKARPWRREGDRLMKWLDKVTPPSPYERMYEWVCGERAAGRDTLYVGPMIWSLLEPHHCIRYLWSNRHGRQLEWLDVHCPAGCMAIMREEDK